jgi:hypothetical protein
MSINYFLFFEIKCTLLPARPGGPGGQGPHLSGDPVAGGVSSPSVPAVPSSPFVPEKGHKSTSKKLSCSVHENSTELNRDRVEKNEINKK